MHRDGKLKNEIEFYGGGLLTVAVRVNRIEMVRLLLDLGFDPDEAAAPAEDGGESWGFPLVVRRGVRLARDCRAAPFARGRPRTRSSTLPATHWETLRRRATQRWRRYC